jgi:hypothetical protein
MRTLTFITIACAACAEGSDDGTTSTTGGGVPWTTSTGVGGANAGGNGDGGAGGLAAGGAGAGGRPSVGGAGGSGGAPVAGGRVVMLGVGTGEVLAGAFDGTAWSTSTLSGSSTDRPALVMRGPNDAVGMFRNSGNLSFTGFDGSSWAATANVGASITTRATPAMAANAATAFAVFHGDDFMHYFAAYTASFNPSNEPVGSPQSFGPSSASVTLDGSDVLALYAGSNGDLYDQRRSGGAWQPASAHALGDVVALTPAVVALESGAILVVYVNKTTSTLTFSVRDTNVWSAPIAIAGALSNDPVAVASLPGDQAMAAFRGTNGQVYAMTFDLAGPAFSAPTAIASPNPTTPSTPAVAAGIDGSVAELAFVDGASGAVHHVRWSGTTWSSAIPVGGAGLFGVAIASSP